MSPPTTDSTPYAVIFDLEFTAWETSMVTRWLRPGEFKEVVQIGAVKLNGAFEPLASFDRLVRPRLNPLLSDYLVKLTGISNAALDAGAVDFATAYRAFVSFAAGLPVLAFGPDHLVLSDNLRLYGMKDAPALPPFLDLRNWFQANGLDIRGMHSCDVGPAAGVPFEGHSHNGLADAQSLAAGVRVLMARGAPRPVIA
jgi:inhibitor of KinA sporulation pathway (predicted exonuclease)